MDGSTRVDYGSEEAAMQAYLRDGEERAAALGNRGPIRFTKTGDLHPDIVDAYWRCGFYVFEGVLSRTSSPTSSATCTTSSSGCRSRTGATVDRKGRPALAVECEAPTLLGAAAGDPFGGTDRQRAASGEDVRAEARRRCAQGSGLPHPGLAAVLRGVAARLRPSPIAGRGGGDQRSRLRALQRGALDQGARPRRARWPGTRTARRTGTAPTGTRASTASTSWPSSTAARPPTACGWCRDRTSAAGSTSRRRSRRPGAERLPEAVPILCAPGDVAMTNRQALHGSFANTSKDWRVTVNFGFHRRRSVLGVKAAASTTRSPPTTTSASASAPRLIGYAIDARRQRFPDETPFIYRPHADEGLTYRWDDRARADIKDYNLLDLSI